MLIILKLLIRRHRPNKHNDQCKNPPRISNALPVSVWTYGRPVTLLQLDEATPSIKLSRARTGDQYYTTANRATNQVKNCARRQRKVKGRIHTGRLRVRADFRVADVINHTAQRARVRYFLADQPTTGRLRFSAAFFELLKLFRKISSFIQPALEMESFIPQPPTEPCPDYLPKRRPGVRYVRRASLPPLQSQDPVVSGISKRTKSSGAFPQERPTTSTAAASNPARHTAKSRARAAFLEGERAKFDEMFPPLTKAAAVQPGSQDRQPKDRVCNHILRVFPLPILLHPLLSPSRYHRGRPVVNL